VEPKEATDIVVVVARVDVSEIEDMPAGDNSRKRANVDGLAPGDGGDVVEHPRSRGSIDPNHDQLGSMMPR
jgi:hypothetical protein